LQHRGDLRVLLGQDLLAGDDQADLGPEAREHVHELDAGHPGAHHDEVLGQLLGRVGVAGREHPVPVGAGPLRDARAAARADEDRVGLEGQLAVLGAGDDGVRVDEAPGAVHQADALALEQVPVGALEPAHDARDAVPQRVEVDARPLDREAHPSGPVDPVQRGAARDHGLGGHAVPEVRGAADDVALDERHLGTEACSVGGRLGPGGATADDHEAQRHALRLPAALPDQRAVRAATTSARGSRKSRDGSKPWARQARTASTEFAGRGAGRGGSSCAVLIGRTRSGSWPAAANTSRANWYQLTAPWLVVWNTPGTRSTPSLATIAARSDA